MSFDGIYFGILFLTLIIGVVGFGYLTNQKCDNEKRFVFLYIMCICGFFWQFALAVGLIYFIIICPLVYLGKRIPKLKYLESLLDRFLDYIDI